MGTSFSLPRIYLAGRYTALRAAATDPERPWGQAEASARAAELDELATAFGYEFIRLQAAPEVWTLRRVRRGEE